MYVYRYTALSDTSMVSYYVNNFKRKVRHQDEGMRRREHSHWIRSGRIRGLAPVSDLHAYTDAH